MTSTLGLIHRSGAVTVPPQRRHPGAVLVVAAPWWTRALPWGVALLAVLARMPFLGRAAGNDEAGFLVIGQQWHGAGTSLYGNYWVDRPPLLIAVFRVAAELGGLVPLRLIGAVAVLVIVLGSSVVARLLAGQRAAVASALVAAVLCTTPLMGGYEVNGELLAAPFVVTGIGATVLALRSRGWGRAWWWAVLAGASGAGALLVKQNMADVAVFALVALLLSGARRMVTWRRVGGLVAALFTGAITTLCAVAAFTVAQGTSLVGVFHALYAFRLEAAKVMVAGSHQAADSRMWSLLGSWLLCGGVLLMVAVVYGLASRRVHSVAAWALSGVLLFDVLSVVMGGNFWSHYLVQFLVPISILAGLLVAAKVPLLRILLGAMLIVSLVSWGNELTLPRGRVGSSIGSAIAAASQPSDTIVTVWGHAEVNQAAGLTSPYSQLWSLPAHTLDPQAADLNAVLAGPAAPTWFVAWSPLSPARSGTADTRLLLRTHYRLVGRFHGHGIYLHDGVRRPVLDLPSAGARLAAGPASQPSLGTPRTDSAITTGGTP